LEPNNDGDVLGDLTTGQVSAGVKDVEELGVSGRVVDTQIARSGVLNALDRVCGRGSSEGFGCVGKFRLEVFSVVFSDSGKVAREDKSRD
jgi:hypothetical protein